MDEWKRGMIFLINKTTRSFWNQDLNLIHPITLIETGRKILLKILTERLSKILTKERIFQGSNYAALKIKAQRNLYELFIVLLRMQIYIKKKHGFY